MAPPAASTLTDITGVNQAECFACHKPLDKTSYAFTLKQLGASK